MRLLLSEAAPRRAANARPQGVRDVIGYAGARRKLLLIDDDPSHIDIVQSLLRAAGFRAVHRARRRAAASSSPQEHKPDLAMIDLSMPDMTGWEVAASIARDAGSARTSRSSSSRRMRTNTRQAARTPTARCLPHQADRHAALLECLGAQLNLQWIYEARPLAPARETDLQGALPDHSRHHVDDLYQLGLIGHVRGIQAKLREMETTIPTNKPFATHMRTLVANFDLKRYMNVLEGMRKHG